MAQILEATIKVRRDTAINWTTEDPTLDEGEFGLETDTLKVKIGDGIIAWTSLGYITDIDSISVDDLTVTNEATIEDLKVNNSMDIVSGSLSSFIQAGKHVNGANTNTVVFPTSFGGIPIVTCTANRPSTSASTDEWGVIIEDITTTGFTFNSFNYSVTDHSDANDSVNWIAVYI